MPPLRCAASCNPAELDALRVSQLHLLRAGMGNPLHFETQGNLEQSVESHQQIDNGVNAVKQPLHLKAQRFLTCTQFSQVSPHCAGWQNQISHLSHLIGMLFVLPETQSRVLPGRTLFVGPGCVQQLKGDVFLRAVMRRQSREGEVNLQQHLIAEAVLPCPHLCIVSKR